MMSPANPYPARRGSKASLAADEASIWENTLFELPWLRFLAAVLLVTLAIAVWKRDIITSPPYYDFATGLFVEANFLVESNFDYGALVQQKRFLQGGPAIYVISIMPTMLAVMMKVLPSARAVLIAYHFFTFLCAAIALVLVYALLAPRAGRAGAVLSALALLTAPVFSTQVDMLGMDLPLGTCSLACLWCLTRKRYVAAGLFCLLIMAIKTTGVVLVVATLATCSLLLILSYLSRDGESRRGYWIAFSLAAAAAAVAVLSQVYLNSLPGSAAEYTLVYLRQGIQFQKMLLIWCPDQTILLLVAIIGTHFAFRSWLANAQADETEEPSQERLIVAAHDGLRDEPLLVFSWFMIVALLAAFVSVHSLPRYLAIGMPFLYLILGATLFAIVAWRRWVTAAFALLIAVNLLNSDGRFFPAFDSEGRTGAHLERSREYLRDHLSNIAAVKELAALPGNPTIIAGNPFVHFLTLPRLGYVERPLQGYALNTFTGPTFKSGLELSRDLPRDVVIVSVDNAMTSSGTFPPPEASPGVQVEILYNDRQPSPLVIYRRLWQPEVDDKQLAAWYRGVLRPLLNTFGQAAMLADEGRLDEAAEIYLTILDVTPDNFAARIGYGRLLVVQKKLEEATKQFQEAVRLAPHESEAHQLLGTMLADSRQYDEALAELTRAIELDPKNWEAHFFLGMVYERQKHYVEAADAYAQAVRVKPDEWQYQHALGNVLLLQGKNAEAVVALREAQRLRPDYPPNVNSLGWILATNADANLRNGAEAVMLLERTRANASPESADLAALLDTLAAAYAEVGRYEDAVKTQQQAIDLTRTLAIGEQLLPGMEIRLKLYEAGQPYHESAPPTP